METVISKCTSNCVINISLLDKSLYEFNAIGGFIGYAIGDVGIDINNCYSEGSIVLDSEIEIDGLGGFIGFLQQCVVQNCYSYCPVNYTDELDRGTGGFIGILKGESTIENSYSAGNVVSDEEDGYSGGFIGDMQNENDDITLINCSWLTTTHNHVIGKLSTTETEYNIPTLVGKSFGTDESNYVLLQHKEHIVYAQGT